MIINFPKTEHQRREDFAATAKDLPKLPHFAVGRTWTERETEVLRKACKIRFNEDVRTETLYSIAVAAMRIYESWIEESWREQE